MLCLSSYTILSHFTFQKTSSSNELLLLLFDGLWKVKVKYIVLFLNASVKFQNARKDLSIQSWWAIAGIAVT